jgi:ribosome biogenesis protein YTM1
LCDENVKQVNLEALFVCLFTLIGNDPEKQFREIDFDFLVCGEVLRVPLSDHLQERSVSIEVTVDVEYFERVPAPAPQDCLLHDDWVSAVHLKGGW